MRFRVRHTQQTIADHIETRLLSLGWMDGILGAKPVRLQEVQPDEVADIEPNLVSTLIDDVSADSEEELGAIVGGLMSVTYDLAVDVYGEKLSITWSIADDIKDALTYKIIPLLDYSTDPAIPTTARIEFERVRITKPLGTVQGADIKRNWRSVIADAVVFFQYEPERVILRGSGDASAASTGALA